MNKKAALITFVILIVMFLVSIFFIVFPAVGVVTLVLCMCVFMVWLLYVTVCEEIE